MNPAEHYILNQKEPYQSLMLYVRSVIQRTIPEIEEKFSYGIPFYHYAKKPMMYLNVLKETNFLDVAFMQGVLLENRFPELSDYKNRKKVRSIQIGDMEDFDELRFVELLKAASVLIITNKTAWKP
jgi:hypothetical protein